MKMRLSKASILWMCVLMMLVGANWGCQTKTAAHKLTVAASLFPLYDFARGVAGADAEVKLILPPGVEAHSFEPKPGDIATISQADVFIYINDEMEPWAARLLRVGKNDRRRVIAAAEDLNLIAAAEHEHEAENAEIDHHHGNFDPHLWLDFENDQRIVMRIAESLSACDEKHRADFNRRAAAYNEQLKALDEKYRTVLGNCRSREFVVGGHAAFGYLARRYGLKQLSLYGINPKAEPTPRQMAQIASLAKTKGIKTVFFDSSLNPRLAQVLAEEIGARTRILHPGHNLTAAQRQAGVTFIRLMEENLAQLEIGLECGEK